MNCFLIAKGKVVLPLIESINEKKSLYINVFNRKNLINIDKAVKTPCKNKKTNTHDKYKILNF